MNFEETIIDRSESNLRIIGTDCSQLYLNVMNIKVTDHLHVSEKGRRDSSAMVAIGWSIQNGSRSRTKRLMPSYVRVA